MDRMNFFEENKIAAPHLPRAAYVFSTSINLTGGYGNERQLI
jgi:hypothetical protein